MPTVILSAFFLALLAMPVASSAQWLNPHLDNQRWSNLRKHQQKLRQQNRTKSEEARKADSGKAERDKTEPNGPASTRAAPKKDASLKSGPAEAASARARPLTPDERQATWSRNKAEYRQRLLRDGQESADRWLDKTALSGRP